MPPEQLEDVLDDPVAHLDDEDPAIRRLALAACRDDVARRDVRTGVEARVVLDPDGSVRARAIEVLAQLGTPVLELVLEARHDEDVRVAEAVATALGEIGSPVAIAWLAAAARNHADRMVREAAVAALGEIGDPAAVPVLLEVLESGPPQVRRRAVVALTVFDDPAIEPALRRARSDRNPMVREVAEMVVGRPHDSAWSHLDLAPRPPANGA